jgi:cell division protein FtsN
LLTKSIITGILLASLGGGTYYYGEDSIRHYLEERLEISRVKKQIIPVKPKRSRTGNTVDIQDSAPEFEYTFFKTLISSKDNSFPGLKKSHNQKTIPSKVSKPRKVSPKPPNLKEKVVKKAPVIPNSKLHDEESLDYMVQVSSFRELTGAELMKSKLIANGYPAFLLRVEIPDKGIWYRVYLGKYAKKEEAVIAAESAKTRDKLSAVVHHIS